MLKIKHFKWISKVPTADHHTIPWPGPWPLASIILWRGPWPTSYHGQAATSQHTLASIIPWPGPWSLAPGPWPLASIIPWRGPWPLAPGQHHTMARPPLASTLYHGQAAPGHVWHTLYGINVWLVFQVVPSNFFCPITNTCQHIGSTELLVPNMFGALPQDI
jgi:hypothetical protein